MNPSTLVLNGKDFLKTFGVSNRDISINLNLENAEALNNLIEVYSEYKSEYSAVLVLIKVSELPEGPKIAMIYGKFEHSILGGSFNLPPTDSPSELYNVPEIDMSIQQLTAYKGDTAGANYFSTENAPPACSEFNYSVMSMDVTPAGNVSIKPKGWKSGHNVAYTLKTSEMTRLDVSLLQNVSSWCKVYFPVTQTQDAQPQIVSTLASTEKDNTGWMIFFVVLFTVLTFAAILYMKRRS